MRGMTWHALIALLICFGATASASAATWVVAIPQATVRQYIGGPVLFTLKQGTVVALTGRCNEGFSLDRLDRYRPWHQQLILSHYWCETVPLLGQPGWIYGGYLAAR